MHPGPPPRFLGGFIVILIQFQKMYLAHRRDEHITVWQNFFAIKFSGATREMILRETIGGIDDFSKL